MKSLSLVDRLRQDTRGQALIETALCSPLLIMVLFGMIEVGRYAHYSIAIANSARAGAEYATLSPSVAASPSLMTTAALNDASSLSPTPTATATTFCQCFDGGTSTCGGSDCQAQSNDHVVKYVKVTVTGTYQGLFHYPGLNHSITVSKTAIVQYPQW